MHIGKWFQFERKDSKSHIELQAAQKLKEAQSAAALSEANMLLDALASMYERGFQLLGIESVTPTTYFAIAISQIRKRQRPWFLEIEMYRLPFVHHQEHIGHMDICLCKGRTVELVDWNVRETNQGHGSILMKHTLSFLRTIGYDYFVGKIQPQDYNHLELLLHFYQKFGFEVTPRENCHALKLYLFPDSKSYEQSMAKDNACLGHGVGSGEVEIRLQPIQLRLDVGQQTAVAPEILLAHTPLDSATFFSQNSKIASINDIGIITGVSPGTTEVFYQCGEIGAYCRVTVATPEL